MVRHPSFTLLSFLIAGTLISSCKDRSSYDSGLKTASQEALDRIKDHKAPSGKGPQDTLTTHERVANVFSAQCGSDRSTLGLFRKPLPPGREWAWFEERKIRKWAAPAAGKSCAAGEEYDAANSYCWRPLVFQFFPVAKKTSDDHFAVDGTSPLMRFFDPKEAPAIGDSCRFDQSSALIFVAGILNPFLGESWQTTDGELLASILAWNRSQTDADANLQVPFRRKLRNLPGYIQIVGNANGTLGGIWGSHEENAIMTLVRNIELAYKAGVRNLEIVTHSNGMITSHVALTEIAKLLKSAGPAWKKARDEVTKEKMAISLFHLQAAPSQKWAMSELDSFGNNSDFLPNAKWVKRTSLGIPYWGWEWDFSAYTTLERYSTLSIDFFYNAPDQWTFPWTTSVGRYVSWKWHKEVAEEGYAAGIRTPIVHHICGVSKNDVCGPEHVTREALWNFANPGLRNQTSIPWEIEFSSGRTMPAVAAATPAVAPQNANQGAESASRSAGKIPDFICVDLRKNNEFCRAAFAQSHGKGGSALSGNTICALPGDKNSPCSSDTCGDGICSLSETPKCSDCTLPASVNICECADGVCQQKRLTCRGKICNWSDLTAVADCHCMDSGEELSCRGSESACRLEFDAVSCQKTVTEPTAAAGFGLTASDWQSKLTKPVFDLKQFTP
jgi:hypothetical protein